MRATYGLNDQAISDKMVRARQLLKEAGIQVTLRTLAETMKGVTAKTKKRDFNVIIASYVAMRKNGVSHSEATVTIQGLSAQMP